MSISRVKFASSAASSSQIISGFERDSVLMFVVFCVSDTVQVGWVYRILKTVVVPITLKMEPNSNFRYFPKTG